MTTPTIKTHDVDEAANLGESCGIGPQSCRRQISRYTCPSCNLFYCSLSCFRSESHSQCSETFYRKEIEIGIKSGLSKSKDDRSKMLELLQRVQDGSAVDEDTLLHHSDEESVEDTLAQRFSGVDISSASTDDLLRLLNKKEKDRFFAALRNPSSGLVQELLRSTEFEDTKQLPWWEASLSSISCGVKPDMMTVPVNLINQTPRGTSLLYNLCVVLLAYVHVTRILSISPLSSSTNDLLDQHQARETLLQSVPFLRDRKSNILYLSLSDAVLSFWSQLHSEIVDKSAILILLEDVSRLVRPQRIVVAETLIPEEKEKVGTLSANHPFSTTIMVLSDLCSLFNTYPDSRQNGHIVKKLTFYAAHILSTPPSHLHALADEVHLFSKRMGREVH